MVPILALIGACFLVHSPCAAAQDSPDNQPHIQPRDHPSTPAGKAKAPEQQSPQTPPETEQQGESSSKDSQIDLSGASRANLPVPAGDDADEKVFRPWDPHRAAKDIEVGNLYLNMKNYRAALERFNDALLYKPNDAEATFGLAATQEKLDLFSKARLSYSRYLELLPQGPKAKECQSALKRLESRVAAAPASNEAAKQAADDIAAGETFLSRNDFASAHERFEDALRLTPENPKACFRLAQSLQGLERPEPARLYYQKYLALEPQGPYAADARKAIADINFFVGK